ncbi:hypothetical protein FDP41_010360 [Naegleria fowleri]|uniref:Uncharacterized protein n=1 Tax=Naegleria fowleri TaxID=5763 RepID=A0A6A5CD68_NAEFO|nr:uncharacterized protein FDP41_010360 [Naegleria fowleri]KAF0983295.1 hypothetical protein FDP41_010360 [Naegleria fowleri]
MEDLHHSSNSQMQSLKSILAQNKFRHHQNNYECVDSDESPVTSASTVEPLSPFPSNNQHNGQNIHNNLGFDSPPKLIIPNVASSTNESCESYQNQHSQLKPKKLDFSIDLSSALDNSSGTNIDHINKFVRIIQSNHKQIVNFETNQEYSCLLHRK